MAEYLIQGSSLTSLANAVRTSTGLTDTLTISQMVSAINNNVPSTEVWTLTLEDGSTVTKEVHIE